MRQCESCGKPLGEQDLFCPDCGGRAVDIAQAPASQSSLANGNKTQSPVSQSSLAGGTPAYGQGMGGQNAAGPRPGENVPISPVVPTVGPTVCPDCGAPIAPGGEFCGSCGRKIAAANDYPKGFCGNCGAAVEAGMGHCPVCGAPRKPNPLGVSVGKVKEKRKLSRRMVAILSSVAGVLVLAGIALALFLGPLAPPSLKFMKGQGKILEPGTALFSRMTSALDSLSELSTDMTLTGRADDATISRYLEDSAVELKVDMGKEKLIAEGELTLMGSDVLSAGLTYEDGVIGVCIPEVEDTYYVADLKQLSETLGLSEYEDMPEFDEKKLKKVGDRYKNLLFGLINGDTVYKQDTDSFRLEGLSEEVDGTVYVFEPTAGDIEEFLLNLADTLEDDQELEELYDQAMEASQAARELEGYGSYEQKDYIQELVDELRDSAEEIAEQFEESGIRWELGLEGSTPRMSRVYLNNNGDHVSLERDGDRTLLLLSINGETATLLDMDLEKDGGKYSGEITIGPEGSSVVLEVEDMEEGKTSALEIPYGEYTLRTGYGEAALTLTVEKGEDGGTDHQVLLSNTGFGEMEFVLHTSDKASTAEKPQEEKEDISDYSQQELNDLAEELEGKFQELGQDISSSLYSGYGR